MFGWWCFFDFVEVLFLCSIRESCVVGNVIGANVCDEGYEGLVCVFCVEGYWYWGGKCLKCGFNVLLVMFMFGIMVFIVFLVYIFCKFFK